LTTGIRPRLLGLDVDGTLLGPGGEPRPGLAEALDEARRKGLRVVLCTGRRYRRAVAMARRIGLDAPLVCNSGALVKAAEAHATLWRADFSSATLARLLGLFGRQGERPLSFVDHDEAGPDFTIDASPTGDPGFDDYVASNRHHAEIDPEWIDEASRGVGRTHFHVCAIGDRPRMLRFEAAIRADLDDEVLCFVQRSPRYAGWMCEILRADAGKWSALWHVAEGWGIAREEICAIGDDLNDRPMIAGAGLGVAMPHAPESVREVADLVLPDRPETALAEFVRGLVG
jgi:HAD superfamily hydrolase (TIGR01484 family)